MVWRFPFLEFLTQTPSPATTARHERQAKPFSNARKLTVLNIYKDSDIFMALELRQSLSLTQQLIMTPQLQQALKLLVLRDVAEDIQMHESTISRVTTSKNLTYWLSFSP